MLNFFNRENRITKLYEGLPPGERIEKLFEQKVEPFLSQYEFKFVKSQRLFKRKIGPLTHEIYIAKSKWNHADEVCAFWLIFSVMGCNYSKWHKQNYGTPPLNECVTSFYHNHLKNWDTKYKLDKYDLSKQDNETVFNEIIENLEKFVLPHFDKFSDYEKSADTLMQNKEYWDAAKIYDYYLIAGKQDKAKQALLAGKEYYSKLADPQRELFEAFKQRLDKIA